MDLELAGKSVVITGGSRGIGYACADLFAQEGCDVAIVASKPASISSALLQLRSRHGERVRGICLDLAKSDDSMELARLMESVDIVVNNAGAIPGGGLASVDDETWRAAWDLKIYGYINAARQALPAMTDRRHGVIVNVIGIAGSNPRYDYVCGSMANAALIAFTKAAGGYSSKHGVRVVGVNPGPTETERLIQLYQRRAEERFGDASRWREMLADLPFGRPAKPEEIADLVVFLASARAAYLSGVVIDADGGGRYA